MIRTLTLKNVALIKQAQIDFSNGINVLSGETGAGKTVILTGLNFVLGQKADKSMIRRGENSCECEICFDIENNSEVTAILNEYGIDYDNNEVVVRRRLFVDGRSDVKVNGVTVTLSMLKRITLLIADVYGQSEHYSLLEESSQLKVLDGFIGEEVLSLKEEIKTVIKNIKDILEFNEKSGGNERERANKIDLLNYQINEIKSANLVEGEEEELINRNKIYQNTERIGEALSLAKECLTCDNGCLDSLSTATSKVGNITDFSSKFSELYDRLYSQKAELDDIATELENELDNLDFDEQDRNFVAERLDLYHTLKRKYGADYKEITEYLDNSEKELQFLVEYEETAKKNEELLNKYYGNLEKLYKKLTLLRQKYAKELAERLLTEIRTLGMKNAEFIINVTQDKDYKFLSSTGIDKVEFLFSANKGEPLKTMSKIISGGEMSRFMLSLKLVSGFNGVTYIFDEIDAGISGEVAKIVAEKFAVLSKKSQIITISHLPQIVSFADVSFKILKVETETETETTVIPLDENGRAEEIMRIIGGNDEISKNHAVSLIQKAKEFKKSL